MENCLARELLAMNKGDLKFDQDGVSMWHCSFALTPAIICGAEQAVQKK